MSAGFVALVLLLAGAGAVAAEDDPADSSAFEAWRLEEALDESDEEGAFARAILPEEGAVPRRAGVRAFGDLVFADDGARRLRATFLAPRAGAALVLAREAGETRPVDDAYAALRLEPARGLRARLGWFEPRAGAGLVLGPRRTSAGVPAPAFAAAARPSWFDASLAASPARAAAGHRGVGLELERGRWRLGVLASATPRDARASGAALQPVLGVRHRNAGEEARRGRLDERILALLAETSSRDGRTWRAWLTGLAARTDPRRAPHEGTSARAESAAAILDGGPAGEAGARWRSLDGRSLVEGALALDAGGRARTRGFVEVRGTSLRASLLVETEARGFVPPRALPERRPRAHAGIRLARPGFALEAHAVERGPLERARPWIALEIARAPSLVLTARHDGEPRATRLALRLGDAPARAGVEVRFDRAGLARRAAWVSAATALPAGFVLSVDARLSGGRSGAVWIENDLSGGRLVRPGAAAARTRFEVARSPVHRRGLAPRLSWTRTTSPAGQDDDLRLDLVWSAGFAGIPGRE